MSEYWVSTPKRYCDACKCYISDDKTVVQVHEQGKRHKENVAKRLEATAKKGAKVYAEQSAYDAQMAAIENAAVEAFKKDKSSLGDQDRREISTIMKRREEEKAQAALNQAAASENEDVAASTCSVSSPMLTVGHIRTPDETKGIAGGWVTVSVKQLPPEDTKPIETEELDEPLNIEDIPLPVSKKKKKMNFGLKAVTLDPAESSIDVKESDVKTAFGGLKRKINRGNMRRQRTDD